MSSPPSDSTLRCSFCARRKQEVRTLVAGPSASICDECIATSWELVDRETAPPRVRTPSALPWARRDAIVVEVRRALEAAFPERWGAILHDVEILVPPGGPLICHDCRDRQAIPDPCPDDHVCADWKEETWTARGYQRAEGVPVAWPWLQVLERRHAAPPSIEYVVLAPLLLRRPVQLTANAAAMPRPI